MEALFAKEFMPLWAFVLALALFFPVRRLIWVLYVRRAARKEAMPDEAEQARLRRRAGFTAGLLCLVFSFLYVLNIFGDAP